MVSAVLARTYSGDLRLWSVLGAVFIYALWGTPTPDAPGFTELAVGLLLLFAVGIGGAAQAFRFAHKAPWQKAGMSLFFYGFSVPVLIGVASGNQILLIGRDLIAFLFILMPLFLYPLFAGKEGAIKMLTGTAVFVGLAFSMRVVWPYVSSTVDSLDPFLLANAPTVLFAAILLLGMSGLYLFRADLFKSALCFFALLVPLTAMALILQRASVGLFCMSGVVLLGIGLVHRPLRIVLPLVLLLAAAIVYWPDITEVIRSLMRKTSLVGFNMRWQEAAAVLDALGGSFFTVLFGKGWGATIASPAVGGATVNFTHSLITTYWLKTGLVGVCFVLFYLYRLGLMVLGLLGVFPVMALALAGPFVIDILLYASFKSLDFGLVLLLIPLWAGAGHKLHKKAAYSMQE